MFATTRVDRPLSIRISAVPTRNGMIGSKPLQTRQVGPYRRWVRCANAGFRETSRGHRHDRRHGDVADRVRRRFVRDLRRRQGDPPRGGVEGRRRGAGEHCGDQQGVREGPPRHQGRLRVHHRGRHLHTEAPARAARRQGGRRDHGRHRQDEEVGATPAISPTCPTSRGRATSPPTPSRTPRSTARRSPCRWS